MSDLPPVRDVHGRKVWRVKVAAPHEMTCTICGETTVGDYCIRCSAEADINQRHVQEKAGRLVPTLSYLHDDEYERTY